MKPASAIKSNPKDMDKKKTSSKFQSKKIHVAIDDCFDTIEGNVDKPNTVRIRLQWVNEILHTQEASLNSLTIATLFNRLAIADFLWWEGEQSFHDEATKLLTFGLSVLAICLKQQSTHCSLVRQNYSNPHFTIRELCEILGSLTKLPIKWQKSPNKPLLNIMLHKTLNALQENEQQDQDIVVRNLSRVASTLARLKFRHIEYEELTKYLLLNIETNAAHLFLQSRETQSQIWQYLAVLQAGYQMLSEQQAAIFEQLELQLAQNKETPAPQSTQLQQEVTAQLRQLCTQEALEDLKIEYIFGCYSMDIAFPKHKLNIEIDGKHHYLESNMLRYPDKLRDFVLNKLKDFCVVRIPHYEWCPLLTKEQKITYLRDTLEKNCCGSILKPTQIAHAYQQQQAERPPLTIVRRQQLVPSQQDLPPDSGTTLKPK